MQLTSNTQSFITNEIYSKPKKKKKIKKVKKSKKGNYLRA